MGRYYVGNPKNTGGELVEKDQIYGLVDQMWAPVFAMIGDLITDALTLAAVLVVGFVVLFFLCCRINPFRLSPAYLERLNLRFLPYDLMRWVLYDLLNAKNIGKVFRPYGFTIFVGPQGAGKTTSMVKYCLDLKRRYPDCKLVTNFRCSFADYQMSDWRDFLEIRNGEDGVIFALDEIHSEYSSAKWQDFPESILSEISQQRKQKIKIVATAQMFSRVAKPIREQAFSVVVCRTYYGRLTTSKEYDSARFVVSGDSAYSVRKGVKPIWRSTFVQSNALRETFDTFEKIERLQKLEFIPRDKRGAE